METFDEFGHCFKPRDQIKQYVKVNSAGIYFCDSATNFKHLKTGSLMKTLSKINQTEGFSNRKKPKMCHFHHLNVNFGTNRAQILPPPPPLPPRSPTQTVTYSHPSTHSRRFVSSLLSGCIPLPVVRTTLMKYSYGPAVLQLPVNLVFRNQYSEELLSHKNKL